MCHALFLQNLRLLCMSWDKVGYRTEKWERGTEKHICFDMFVSFCNRGFCFELPRIAAYFISLSRFCNREFCTYAARNCCLFYSLLWGYKRESFSSLWVFAIENFALSCPELRLILFPPAGFAIENFALMPHGIAAYFIPCCEVTNERVFPPTLCNREFCILVPRGFLLAVTHVLAVEFSAVMI